MKSIISINVSKFKEINCLDLYKIINDKIDGCELHFNFNDKEELEYVENLLFYFNRDNFYYQFHGNSNLTIDKQKEYLLFVNKTNNSNNYINIVLHSLTFDNIEDALKQTSLYIDELEEFIEENNLKITLSLENLNSIKDVKRLSKEDLFSILYNNDKLNFTYDIGHEIEEYGLLTNLSDIEIKRINNVHIHTFKNNLDHLPIYDNDEHILNITKSLLYLRHINYNGPIVFEYDLYECNGNTLEEKVIGYIDSIKFVENYLKKTV